MKSEVILNLNNNVSLLLAFSAGLLSFLSPCVLPLVPAYITYLVGDMTSIEKNRLNSIRVFHKALGFVAGFSTVFILLGASASALGKLLGNNTNTLRVIGGIVIIIFGIHISGLIKIPFLYKEKRVMEMNKVPNFSSFLLGMAFAAGWTPCIGPILASILIVAGNSATVWTGILLLVAYSAGLSIPFLLFAVTLDRIKKHMVRLNKALPVISIISGALLVLMGILVITNKIRYLGSLFT